MSFIQNPLLKYADADSNANLDANSDNQIVKYYFVPIENQEELLRQENLEDSRQLVKETEELLDISGEINRLLGISGEQLIQADTTMENATETIENTEEILCEANTYSLKSKQKKIILGATLAGVCIGGPVGGILGAQTSVLLSAVGGISGLILGGGLFGAISSRLTSNKIQKLKDKYKE